MSIDKSQFKAAVLHEIGCDFEDQLERSRTDLHRVEGRIEFGKLVTEKLRGLQAHLQKDVDEEQLAPEDAAVRSKQIQTAINLVSHLVEKSAAELLKSRGRVDQCQRAILLLKEKHNQQVAKCEAQRNALAIEEAVGPMRHLGPTDRPNGIHPGASLKQRRREEDEAVPEAGHAKTKRKATKRGRKRKTNNEAKAP